MAWPPSTEYQDWKRIGNHWRMTFRPIDFERVKEMVFWRHHWKEMHGVRDPRFDKRRTGEEAHVMGAFVEAAVEEFTGVKSFTHTGLHGDDRIKDFTINGLTVQCKGTHHLIGRLHLTPSKHSMRADYALFGTGDGNEPLDTKRVTIIGVIPRRKLFEKGVCVPSTQDRKGKEWQKRCDIVEQFKLTPMHEIFPPRRGISLDFDKVPFDARPDPWKQGALPLE